MTRPAARLRQMARFVLPLLLMQLITIELWTANAAAAAADACGRPKLLGIFVPWYQYLTVKKDSVTGACGIDDSKFSLLPGGNNPSSLLAILLAVVDDLLRLAGLIAVFFVIMGGIQYATSQGNPDATAKAQSTVINALIGLLISLVAVAFVTYIGGALT